MEDRIEYDFSLTPDDYARFQRWVLKYQADFWQKYGAWVLVVAALVAPLLFVDFKDTKAILIWFIIAGFLFITTCIGTPIARRLSKKAVFKNHGQSSEPVHVGIGPEGVDIAAANGTATNFWNTFNCLHETETDFYLGYKKTNKAFVIIPKRCLDESQIAPLRETILHHLNAAAPQAEA